MPIKKAIRDFIYNRDGNICLRCGTPDNLTIDHVIPLSKQGRNHKYNLQTLCYDCNQDKGDNIVDYRWIEDMPLTNFKFKEPIPKRINQFAEPKKKKLKEIVKELGFYDNPVKMQKDIFLQHQTHEQFMLAKKFGWEFARMITEPQKENFHYE